jgi:hypothetical protein
MPGPPKFWRREADRQNFAGRRRANSLINRAQRLASHLPLPLCDITGCIGAIVRGKPDNPDAGKGLGSG